MMLVDGKGPVHLAGLIAELLTQLPVPKMKR